MSVDLQAMADSYGIRRHALLLNIPYFTTMAPALAFVEALGFAQTGARPSSGSQHAGAALAAPRVEPQVQRNAAAACISRCGRSVNARRA